MEHEYSDIKNCEICNKGFGITRARHKCKRCKLIICADCGKTKSIIIGYSKKGTEAHRICNLCQLDVEYQKDFRTNNESGWNKTSKVAATWLSSINLKDEIGLIVDQDYDKFLKDGSNASAIKALVKDLRNGKADRQKFNYSLLEFLHYSQEDQDLDKLRFPVHNVLRAFYNRTKLPHCNVLLYVATFLLSLAEEKDAFGLLCYLNDKILPPNYWNRRSEPISYEGMNRVKYTLKTMAMKHLKFDSPEHQRKFEIGYNKAADFMFGGILVGTLNFNASVYVFNKVFTEKSFKPIEDTLLKVIVGSQGYYQECYELPLRNFQIHVCRKFNSSNLAENALTVTAEEKEAANKEYEETTLKAIVAKKEKVKFTLKTFKDLSQKQFEGILLEVSRLLNMVMTQMKMKTLPENIDITKKTFIATLKEKGGLSNLTDEQLEGIFDAMNVRGNALIPSTMLCGLLLLLLTEGDVEAKFSEFYKLKDFEGKNKIDPKAAQTLFDSLAEILTLLNELESDLLFQYDVFELKEKLRKKTKKQKLKYVTLQDMFEAARVSPLLDLINDTKEVGTESKPEEQADTQETKAESPVTLTPVSLTEEVEEKKEETAEVQPTNEASAEEGYTLEFKIHKAPAKGSSLFHSVARAFENVKYRAALTDEAKLEVANSMKNEVIQYMKDHASSFSAMALHPYRTVDEYINYLKQDNAVGGATELRIFSEKYGVQFHLFKFTSFGLSYQKISHEKDCPQRVYLVADVRNEDNKVYELITADKVKGGAVEEEVSIFKTQDEFAYNKALAVAKASQNKA